MTLPRYIDGTAAPRRLARSSSEPVLERGWAAARHAYRTGGVWAASAAGQGVIEHAPTEHQAKFSGSPLGPAATVQAQIGARCPSRPRRDYLALVCVDVSPQRLGDVLYLRSGHVQSGQFLEHLAAAGEADLGGHAADHVLESRRDRSAIQAQRGVAGVAALAARAAMAVGAFQCERSQGCAEGLGAVPVEARLLATTATTGGSLQIAPVGIMALREDVPHQFQGGRQLDGFDVQVLA